MVGPRREGAGGPAQLLRHGARTADGRAGLTDQPEAGLHCLVRVQDDCATASPLQSSGERAAEGPALRLVALARMQPPMHLVPLGFAPHPGQPEQSAVVGLTGGVDTLRLGTDGATDGAQCPQARPVRAVARHTRRLHAEDEANRAQTALGSEMLAAKTLIRLGTTLGQSLVDDLHPRGRPAKRHRPLDQLGLPARAFRVFRELTRCGLADRDICQLGAVRLGALIARLRLDHGCSPGRRRLGAPASVG